MKEYIVSARKYRPMTFDSVVGQSSLTTTLKNAVKSGKLAHAYLFCGPRGVGKTTCARIFAKAINCEHPTPDGDACNECESCKAFQEQRSYNMFELDAASNNGVEQIKTLMEQTRIPPQVGRYKVFIIDEVHMLSTSAFNAFLKTLEEPPAHVIFILATTEKHKILPTIISRCQIYDFERMTVPNIINHLKMVAKADGGMRDALSIFDQAASFCQGNITYQKVIEDLNVLDSENYFNIIDLSIENKVSDVMVLLNNVISKGFDGGHLINGLAQHVRNVLMAKDEQTLPLLEVSQRQADKYMEQAKKCPARFLYQALKLMNQCDLGYRQSSNKRLLVELTLIEIAQITQEEDTPAAGRSPRRLKSLFQKLVRSVQQQKTAQQVAAAEPKPLHTARVSAQQNGSKNQDADARPVAPKLKLGNLGMSFANLRKGDGKKPIPETTPLETAENEQQQFTEEEMIAQWVAMCQRMPQQMAGIAARMRNMRPHITEYPHILAVVDNQILLDQMNAIRGRIRSTLALALHNDDITLDLQMAQDNEVTKVLSRKELFEEISTKNPAISKLRGLLDLELA